MPMQTSHGLDRVPSTKHVNHLSVKKGERYETETYLAHTQMLYPRLPFHSLWESGVQKSYISFLFIYLFFSIQLSKDSDSSYISHWIDLCFQQSSPLLVCWLVERWQIGFHSLHGGAQWSGFDRVKRNSASVPPPSPHLSFSVHTHAHTSLFNSLSFSLSLSSLGLREWMALSDLDDTDV